MRHFVSVSFKIIKRICERIKFELNICLFILSRVKSTVPATIVDIIKKNWYLETLNLGQLWLINGILENIPIKASILVYVFL